MEKVTWRLALLWGSLFSFNALATCVLAGLQNANWASMSGQARFMTFVAIAANWTGTIMAFVSKTFARLEKTNRESPSPVSGGGTELFNAVVAAENAAPAQTPKP